MSQFEADAELVLQEQKAESLEEKAGHRSRMLVEASRPLSVRRAVVEQLGQRLVAAGGQLTAPLRELLASQPLSPSGTVDAQRRLALQLRAQAAELRLKAAQAWDEELGRQQAQLNRVSQGLVRAEQELQQLVDQLEAERAAAAAAPPPEPEPVLLTRVNAQAPVPRAEPSGPQVRQTTPMPAPVALWNLPGGTPKPAPLPPTGAELRSHARARFKVRVDFESDHNFYTGFSADISEGGLFVATLNLQPRGSAVEVAFSLPTGEQVVARGHVRWVRESSDRDPGVHAGMGIQFDGLSTDAREAVHRFIDDRDPIFFEE